MSWINDTVADFGRQLGMPQLDLGDHGVMQLAFASGGLLAVEPVQRGEGYIPEFLRKTLPLTDTRYLNSRGISSETLASHLFEG
ncbi:MAG: hypothetical protein V4609_01905, partial [Pseudomonadota bacterium]